MSEKKNNNKNKWLDDLGIESHFDRCWSQLSKKQKKEQKKMKKKYGFYPMECWNLDYVLVEFLYTHLCTYYKQANGFIDMTYHKFKYKGKEYNQKQIIKKIIKDLKFVLINANEFELGLYEEWDVKDIKHKEDGGVVFPENFLKPKEGQMKKYTDEMKAYKKCKEAFKLLAKVEQALWW